MFRRLTTLLVTLALLPATDHVLSQEQDPRTHQRDSILLVAARHLNDPNFARTVVLVMFPDRSGPSGVILNRPTSLSLTDVWPEREDRKTRNDTIFVGGPVQPDGLLYLFRMSPPPERAWWITDDIYFSGDGDVLNLLLQVPYPDPTQRFFAGYAGWTYSQLDNEIERGDWHVLELDPDIVYDTDYDTLWLRMYQRATLLRARESPFTTPVMIASERSERTRLAAFHPGLVAETH